MADPDPDGGGDPEVASLKRELQEVKDDLNEVRTDQEQTADALVETFGMPRRSALRLAAGGISAAALAALASSPVAADASTGDSDGDVGTPANRVDVFADGIDANSATLGGFPVARGIGDGDSVTFHGGDQQTITANSWGTVFSVGSAVDIIAGVIHEGVGPNTLRVTWADSSTSTYGEGANSNNFLRGQDDAGNNFVVMPVPAFEGITQLEVFNEAGTDETFGWAIWTT